MTDATVKPVNFIAKVISEDLESGKHKNIVTRFPPEPNGYLHIGHAKSICLNFGLAEQFGGQCHLRFDDTNPEKEEDEYVNSIKEDVTWLGFQWAGNVRYTSDYFDQLHDWALHLINEGKAYVCELTPEQAKDYRGNFEEPGKNSPYRDRSVAENLELFQKMREGGFEEGQASLRAKIDMAAPNMNMRDPVIYRIKKAHHHQTGDKWCIYPSYDFAHGQSDAVEGITHSVCTLEFADHRPLYDWFIENLPVPVEPHQYEFGRLNINYTVTSKRKLRALVEAKVVAGWDDPRMPTISGMRRRGYTPNAIRNFCDSLAVAKTDGTVDVAQLEHFIRDDLNLNAPRAMCVINPLKVVISNMADDHEETLTVPYLQDREELGSRDMPFTKEIFIDQADFKEEYSKKFKKKFCVGKRIRLRHGYVLEADGFEKDADGNIIQVNATLIENTLGCDPEDGDKPKGVVHWVSAKHAKEAELRSYDRMFLDANPDGGKKDFMECLNPESLVVKTGLVEPALANVSNESVFQFEREGYYVADRKDHSAEKPVFNLTIGLRADKSLSE
ncbi:glutamine--tRNA ligase/YqeY domain fusion protein [Bermanella sp. R86510]|uniref:glutamine--tRNA ligase/YqeY domain fusion protein n=1 Tax=unclassified Bermanella TaxID=2627862 RepID=UPI0037C78A17